MRVTLIASLTALLACFVLMASSYFQSIFWNIARTPVSGDRDSITFVQSVVGYVKFGSYTIDKGKRIRSTAAFTPIQDGHDGFRFHNVRQEHGLPRAFLYVDNSHINSKFLTIHYATIALPLLALSVFLYMLIARSKTAPPKTNGEAEQAVAPNGP